jgi:hypothetical protein
MNWNELLKSKTVWTGVAGVVAAASAYFTGQVGLYPAIMSALGSLAAVFIKDAVVSATKPQ